LATGLGSFYKSYDSLWIGWCGIPSDEVDLEEKKDVVEKLITDFKNFPVFLPKRHVEMYYSGFCNKTIWPLFHCFTQYAVYEKSLWESYRRVNELFCDRVVEVAQPDDIIWIHDYHLMLLPKLLREKLPNAQIGFFLHIPFPPFEIFHLLPWRRQILEGLLEADLIGFHTYDYVRNFLDSARRLLGYEHAYGQVSFGEHLVNVDTFPMGIDYDRFEGAVNDAEVQKEIQRIRKKVGERKIILSIDRLDYTKGIIHRLEAFDYFLEKNPKYREKVTLIHVAVPSRARVEHYRMLKKQVDELVGQINGKYGTIGWMPVWYLYRFVSFPNLVALYNIADVGLITPLKDGMNLIAKEFIATKIDGQGVLILTEMAGAARELGEAIIVNPNNKEEIAKALKEALTMPNEEQGERNRIMQRRLQRYNVERWAHDFMESLSLTKNLQQELSAKRLTHKIKRKLIGDSHKSKKRLIFLDYDGTLAPFAEKPEQAKPDKELPTLLEALTKDSRNEVVIVSGRNKESLDQWFKDLNVGLIAEHGGWIKEKGGKWETLEPLRDDWKEEIRPILELYVDRTPGSFVEEKDFSLVWHYRKVDPELASIRARELKDALLHLTANLNLGVLEGNKIIEIKNVGINKGQVALRWIPKEDWDFILAIGDDWTDEDVFTVLPESAYSIKVGTFPSRAKFNLDSVKDVRSLLKDLVV
jgi:trehalose 6-phosphate synthase/phosphatase